MCKNILIRKIAKIIILILIIIFLVPVNFLTGYSIHDTGPEDAGESGLSYSLMDENFKAFIQAIEAPDHFSIYLIEILFRMLLIQQRVGYSQI